MSRVRVDKPGVFALKDEDMFVGVCLNAGEVVLTAQPDVTALTGPEAIALGQKLCHFGRAARDWRPTLKIAQDVCPAECE